MGRLEVLSDIYLSMNAPVQRALPVWLESRAQIQRQIRDRVRTNLAELDRVLAAQQDQNPFGVLMNRLKVEGGWYALLRIPAIQPDELTTRELLNAGVWVHPGFFFGMSESGWLVVSLLTQIKDFSHGIALVASYFRENQMSYPGAKSSNL
jgi:hypothetical protein